MSTLFPALAGHPVLQVALMAAIAVLLIAELGVMIFLVRRKQGSPSQNRVEMVWTVVPALVLAGIVFLMR